MTILNIVHECATGIQNKAFVCTRAEYTNPFTEKKKPIIEHTSQSLNSEANALVIFGDNASGKSLVCNLIESKVRQHHEVRSMSVKNRTSKSIGRTFIFGDEAQQSTGETSVRVVQKAFNGADLHDEPSLIILDEPDLGLSSKYARAMGRFIAQETNRVKEKGVYVIIVSHNIELLTTFCDELDNPTSYIGLNTNDTLDSWLTSDDEKTIHDLLSLTKVARRKEMAINREMDAARRKR